MSEATIITGATRGIGRALALRMSQEGPVLFTTRSASEGDLLCAEIAALGGVASYCVGDLRDRSLVKRVELQLNQSGWSARHLILNAGISAVAPVSATDLTLWQDMFAVNTESPFEFVKTFLPSMLSAGKGTICFMAGMAGIKGYSGMTAYCASKGALVRYAEALAAEVGRKGIWVIPVCPGPVDTDMTAAVVQTLVKRGGTIDDAKAKIAAGSGQKRLLTPQEVADKVAGVCAPAFSGANGEPLIINDK